MSVENQTAIELSEQELDVVSGGADALLANTFFNERESLIAQETKSGKDGSSTRSLSANRNTKTGGLLAIFQG